MYTVPIVASPYNFGCAWNRAGNSELLATKRFNYVEREISLAREYSDNGDERLQNTHVTYMKMDMYIVEFPWPLIHHNLKDSNKAPLLDS